MTRTLAMKTACLRHCVSAARGAGVDGNILEGAEEGLVVLEKIERNAALIKAIAAVFSAFPDAEVSTVTNAMAGGEL